MSGRKDYKYLYTMEYYKSGCGTDYTRKDIWVPFFDNMAERIIEKYAPKTVLDMGCAFGYLVSALRNKGVQAYGIDISEYALSQADEKIKPYVKVMSALDELPDNFPKKYDLVVSIEMIEHLYEDDGLKVIKKMTEYSDRILLSYTDNDFAEPTHVNVQQKEYWCEKFAEHNYFRDLHIDLRYISPNAYLFERKDNITIGELVKMYESVIKIEPVKVSMVRNAASHILSGRLSFIKKLIKKVIK